MMLPDLTHKQTNKVEIQSLTQTHIKTITTSHSQFKDNCPVREEEEVGKASPVHAYENVTPLVLLQLKAKIHLVTVLCLSGVRKAVSG